MNVLRSVSLTDSTAAAAFVAVLLFAVLAGLWGLRSRPRRTLVAAACAALFGLGCWLVVNVTWNPWPGLVPWTVFPAVAAVVFVLGCLLVQRGRRMLMAAATVLALLAGVGVGNLIYQVYPTIGSLDSSPVAVPMSLAQFRDTAEVPQSANGSAMGALVTVPLAGTDSQFPARDAVAYVPPSYWSHPEVALPVVVLMPGNPGQPDQWFTSGQADQAADDFAAGHDGLAPIVISVDATASFTGNPVCTDGPEYQVMTYLAHDVPELIKENFRVNPDQRTWTIGGLSYGGTCSLQVITNHPESYGSFLDFSGEAEPTTGNHDDTVTRFFDGSEEDFQAHNPATLLAQGDPRYAGIAGTFVAGEADKTAAAALSHLDDLARHAGMDTTFDEVPGGHTFKVWRVAIADNLGWAAERGGLK